MKTGTSIEQLAGRILAESKSKRDFVADTRKLRMGDDGTVTIGEIGRAFKPTKICMDQVANRTGIPAKYAERMRTEAPILLARNVNHWFEAKPEKRMIRTLDNGSKIARAFLSDRYRPLDNYDLANVILPKLSAAGYERDKCRQKAGRESCRPGRLTKTDAVAVMAMMSTGRFTKQDIAKSFDVSDGMIGHIANGRAHVKTMRLFQEWWATQFKSEWVAGNWRIKAKV